ncbi:MAG TPA: selenide, water dikinase SelD [Candidatus Dormibacteraeota bacterium]|jgi:selenide,water dikinase|nr:selenide, water dikinase SelD [Candidatus Dormibacteraeota bacterium]
MQETAPRLTSFSHGGGCACKLSPADLAEVLGSLPQAAHESLLVGAETRDDAAVFEVSDELAVVLTADFITPVVDDPAAYGAIAATNAMSDIWAMGGEALLALNLVGFPRDALDLSVLHEILAAGNAAAHNAGVVVAGGHTIDDPELKFGMAVVGRVRPADVIRNSTGQDGDVLVLTKPLGVGIASSAAKNGEVDAELLDAAIAQMTHANRAGGRVMREVGVSAATDVTGFGLLGHLGEVARGSGLGAVVEYEAVPVLIGVRELARKGVVSGGTRRNLKAASEFTIFPEDLDQSDRLVLADAQTSGGLLIAVPESRVETLCERLHQEGEIAALIGRLERGQAGTIQVQ